MKRSITIIGGGLSGLALGCYLRKHGVSVTIIPENREMIRFTNAAGKLRNQLGKNVPSLAAGVVKKLYAQRSDGTDAIVTHGGGRDVIAALESSLKIETLTYAREVMRKYGNLSSPSVMIALEMLLNQATDETSIWMCGFGAGFSAHACELHYT